MGFTFPIALAVTVVEGDITYGGPAVLNDGRGMEFGHDSYGIKFYIIVFINI